MCSRIKRGLPSFWRVQNPRRQLQSEELSQPEVIFGLRFSRTCTVQCSDSGDAADHAGPKSTSVAPTFIPRQKLSRGTCRCMTLLCVVSGESAILSERVSPLGSQGMPCALKHFDLRWESKTRELPQTAAGPRCIPIKNSTGVRGAPRAVCESTTR